jgi:hypothetical protein
VKIWISHELAAHLSAEELREFVQEQFERARRVERERPRCSDPREELRLAERCLRRSEQVSPAAREDLVAQALVSLGLALDALERQAPAPERDRTIRELRERLARAEERALLESWRTNPDRMGS